MNENINLCEILKDTPKGTLLYSPLIGEVKFDEINNLPKFPFPVHVIDKKGDKFAFTQQGTFFESKGECLLFPSKDQRDWSKYLRPFVNGDVITSKGGGIVIFSHTQTHFECSNVVYYHCVLYPLKKFTLGLNYGIGGVSDCRFATEEEKQKLFQAIKDNGYKWNAETKTLEKLVVPKFKVGDRIRHKTTNKDDIYEISKIYDDSYGLVDFTWMIYIKYQDDYELVKIEPKFKVGDRIKHKDDETVITITGRKDDYYFIKFYNIKKNDYQNEKVSFKDQDNYELVPNKFNISTLKPFDKVLVRNGKQDKWQAGLFSYLEEKKIGLDYGSYTKYIKSITTYNVNSDFYNYCIPYDYDTKHLVGTTKEAPKFYQIEYETSLID